MNTEVLDDFEIGVLITPENEEYLKSKDYERRCGSCTYTHKYYVVRPFKKWYYPVDSFCGIMLEVEKVVKTTHKLKVTQPKK
jgi:hypothetical protein